jgi:hypothetical protein
VNTRLAAYFGSCRCSDGYPCRHISIKEDNRYPVHSPLSQRLSRDGTTVEIQIYDDGKDGWLLEVVDEFGNSTVWDESFLTDDAALAEALNWYLRYSLSLRDVEELFAERGLEADHTTIWRWVQC